MTAERVVPVVVKVHEGGRVRTVRVGQAFVTEDEVVLSLEPLTLQLQPAVGATVATVAAVAAAPVASEPATEALPGARAASAQLHDLEWLAQRSRRVLADPRKERWHDDMRLQLTRIEAEMERLKMRSAH